MENFFSYILNFLQFFSVIVTLPLTFYILKQGEKKKSIVLISLGNTLLTLFVWLGVMFIRSFIKSEYALSIKSARQMQELMVRIFQVVNVLSIVIGIMFTLLIIFYAYKEICQIKKEKQSVITCSSECQTKK